jgi:hypothetical protein
MFRRPPEAPPRRRAALSSVQRRQTPWRSSIHDVYRYGTEFHAHIQASASVTHEALRLASSTRRRVMHQMPIAHAMFISHEAFRLGLHHPTVLNERTQSLLLRFKSPRKRVSKSRYPSFLQFRVVVAAEYILLESSGSIGCSEPKQQPSSAQNRL